MQFDVGALERVKTPMGGQSAWRVKLIVFDETNTSVGRNVAIWMSDVRDGCR